MSLPVSRRWQELSWTAFRELPRATVAVMQVAAIEQHGPHLPVTVDATINDGVLARALEKVPVDLPVLVLPMQSVGCSVEHIRYPGTLTATPETLTALWTEIGESVARAGVRRLVILNSHGGQPQIVDIVCRRLRGRARIFAVGCMWSRLGRPPSVTLSREEAEHGIHGGLVETSIMLRLRPDLVDMGKAENFRSAWLTKGQGLSTLVPEGAVGFGWETQDLHKSGALGDASAATADLGEVFLEHAGTKFAHLLEEVHAFDIDGWMEEAP